MAPQIPMDDRDQESKTDQLRDAEQGDGTFQSSEGNPVASTKLLSQETDSPTNKQCHEPLEGTTDRRKKIIQTLCLYCGFTVIGGLFSLVGPTLLDLQLVTKSSVGSIAYAVTSRSIGLVIGSFLFGALYHKCNIWLTFSLCFLLLTVCTAIVPWTGHGIIVLSLVLFLQGGSMGLFDAGSNIMMLHIWEDKNGPWLLFMQGLWGIGSICGPSIAQPFLQQKPGEDFTSNNGSSVTDSINMTFSNDNFELNQVNNSTDTVPTENLELWKAYAIGAVIAFVAMVIFFCVYLFYSSSGSRPKSDVANHQGLFAPHLSGSLPYLIIFIDFMLMISYAIILFSFSNFLMVYSSGHLGWSKSSSSALMSAFFFGYTSPRFALSILIRYIKPGIIILGSVILCNISIMPLFFFINFHVSVLWICTVLCAVSISCIFPANLNWIGESLGVTGKLGSAIFCSVNFGFTIAPTITGVLINAFGQKTILYIIMGATISALVFVAITQALVHYLKNIPNVNENEKDIVVTVSIPNVDKK